MHKLLTDVWWNASYKRIILDCRVQAVNTSQRKSSVMDLGGGPVLAAVTIRISETVTSK